MTPDEAKQQLRVVAAHVGLVPWVKRQPLDAILTAVLAGFLFGRVPHLWSYITRSRVGRKVIDRLV